MKRKAFLEHVGWTGAGIAYTLGASGTLVGKALAYGNVPSTAYFVQISDSHIGFRQAANPDVAGTLQRTVAAINALPHQPQFVTHTGDVTHLAKAEQFATARDILRELRAPLIVIPGEHDMIGSRAAFFETFPTPDKRSQWFSWDRDGVHYVALVNVFDFEKMGLLGNEQIAWLQRDLATQKTSTPIVVFAHVPLYALFPQWGWTTDDGAKALALLRRFDRVTVLNGHIHQVIRHSEGNIAFATADATAYPQPAPGTAAKPGPLALPPDGLLHAIGYRTVELHEDGAADVRDSTLG